MKKVKSDENADYIQFEEGDDVVLLANALNCVMRRDNEGNLYCWQYPSGRVVKYDVNTKKWEEYTENDYEQYQTLSMEETTEIFKTNSPVPALNEIEKREGNEIVNRWERLRKITSHRVVGWSSVYEGVYEYTEDEDELHTAALLNDIVEQGYEFVGMSMYLVPIFEDGTYLDFSARGWGHILALAKGHGGDYDYVDYAFYGDEDGESHYPEDEFYEGSIKLRIKLSNEDYKKVYDAEMFMRENNDTYDRVAVITDDFIFPVEYDPNNWYELRFYSDEDEEGVKGVRTRLYRITSQEEYHKLVAFFEEDQNWNYKIIANHIRIDKKLEEGPVLLTVTTCE